jgi:transposase-like protein
MASNHPFIFADSTIIAPIVCIECGHNAFCVRRTAVSVGEYQLFECRNCGKTSERIVSPVRRQMI